MVTLSALWAPILLSGAITFIVSAMVWMVMPHHKKDFSPPDDQDALMDAVRKSTGGPGMYYFPWAGPEGENSDAYRARVRTGPVGILRVRDPGAVLDMRSSILKSLLLHLVVAVLVAYLASATLPVGTAYLKVFQVTGTAAFLAHGFVGFQESIWFGLPASVAFKHAADGVAYALLTAAIFGWLWPG